MMRKTGDGKNRVTIIVRIASRLMSKSPFPILILNKYIPDNSLKFIFIVKSIALFSASGKMNWGKALRHYPSC